MRLLDEAVLDHQGDGEKFIWVFAGSFSPRRAISRNSANRRSRKSKVLQFDSEIA